MNSNIGFCVWFTGLSASGKSTIADALKIELEKHRDCIQILDGDVVRQGLTNDLGFSKEDRDKNISRVSYVAKLLAENKVGVLCSFISPYQLARQKAKGMIPNFIEVYLDVPLDVCERRDPKGLYRKARIGEITGFTGIDDPYEIPLNPDIELKTNQLSVDQSVKVLENYLFEHNLLKENRRSF